MVHSCYIVFNDINKCTYNGYTVDPKRRLRQHNSEIKGGAKYTCRQSKDSKVTWSYLVIVESEQYTHHTALSHEWHIKYPTNKRPRPQEYNGAEGRISSLPLVFSNPKFINMSFIVNVHPQYLEYTTDILSKFDNIFVKPL